MWIARFIACVLFVCSVVLAITLTNLRMVALDLGTYTWGFERYGATANTGMSQTELIAAGEQLIAYFDRGEPISLQVTKSDQKAPLFNEREMAHLADVRDLFQLAFRAQELALAYVVLFAVAVIWLRRMAGVRQISRLLIWGGAVTIAVLLGAFVATLFDFERLFLQFHLMSFSNDLWILDPRTDYMIRLFPQGFWMEMTISLALRSIGIGVFVILVGIMGLVATRRHSPFSAQRRKW